MNAKQLAAMLEKSHPDDSILQRMKKIQDSIVPPPSQIDDSGLTKELNSVTFKAVIKDFTETPTKTGKKTHYDVIVHDLCVETPISPDAGRRTSKSILLNVYCEQDMNAAQLEEHKAKCDKDNLDAKDKRRDNKQLRTVTDEPFEITVGMTLGVTVFRAAFADRSGKLGDGTYVIIRGIRPTLKKEAADSTGYAKTKYNTTCQISTMLRDKRPPEGDIWTPMERDNHPANFSVADGYGPHNANEEDEQYLKTTAGKTLDSLADWRVRMTQVPAQERPYVRRKFIVVLPGVSPDIVRPFEVAQEASFKPLKYVWEKEWIVDTKDTPPKKLRVATLTITGKMTTKERERLCKVRVKISSHSFALTDKVFHRFGITQPELWANIAPILIPHIGGLLVCDCNLKSSSTMAENDPTLNPLIDGERALGYDYAATYNAKIIEPKLAVGIVNAGFEITVQLAEELVNAVLGKEPELAKSLNAENPLNTDPAQPVLNLMESAFPISRLKDSHRFFVLYVGDCDIISKFRALIAKKFSGPEFIAEFSRLTIAEDEAYLGFPRINKAQEHTFCVFAVSHDAYAAATKPVPELTPEEFMAEVKSIREKEVEDQVKTPRVIKTVPVSNPQQDEVLVI